MMIFQTKSLLLTLLLAVSFSFQTFAQTVDFSAVLTGRAEPHLAVTEATGTITATLTGNQLTVSGTFDNLKGAYDATVAGGAHIHTGYYGQGGGIAFTLTPTLDVDLKGGAFLALTNTFTLNAAQLAALFERQLYVNIHTTAYAAGELRGQLMQSGNTAYAINMTGANEVPVVLTEASGGLLLEVDGDTLIVSGAFQDLSSDFDATVAGGAHLHVGFAGSTGAPVIFLNTTTDADLRGGVFRASDNRFAVTAAQKTALAARMMYSNIHTTGHASGELRGQVTSAAANTVFRTYLSGANETQHVLTHAHGQVMAEITGNSMVVTGAFDDMSSAVNTAIAGGAHLHTGMAGASGGVSVVLNLSLDNDMMGGAFEAALNTFTLDADQMAAIYGRGIYVNIHSMAHAGGELRGQVLPESQAVFTAQLSGNFETKSVLTQAHGMLKAELSGNTLVVSGFATDLSSALNVAIAGGAHIHIAMAGSGGDVALLLVSDVNANGDVVFSPSNNTFTLNAAQKAALLARGCYVNIHTLNHAGGELRGQLMHDATAYFTAMLSGSSQANHINTAAQGAVAIELVGNVMTATGSFNDLSSALNVGIAGGAHLHTAPAGAGGGVAFVLASDTDASMQNGTFAAADNQFSLTAGMVDTLMMRGLYVNVHSMDFAGGEIRGQLLPSATSYLTINLDGLNSTSPNMTTGSGSVKVEVTGNVAVVTGAFASLMGDFDASIAGGSHLHTGGVGMSGGIATTLVADVSADLKSGVYHASDNTYTLGSAQIAALFSEDLYLNLHTTLFPGGEIRGQVLQEINLFPSADAAILTPASGSTVILDGLVSSLVNVTWTPATDPDGDDIRYIWQVALDADFNTVIYQKAAFSATGFGLTHFTLDSLLAENSVMVGASATVYHRVVVSDGCDNAPSKGAPLTMQRQSVSTNNLTLTTLSAYVFPNPIERATPTYLALENEEHADFIISILSAEGQVLSSKTVTIPAGTSQYALDMARLNSGLFFVKIQSTDGKGQLVRKVVRM